jgi:hypothetical protein
MNASQYRGPKCLQAIFDGLVSCFSQLIAGDGWKFELN